MSLRQRESGFQFMKSVICCFLSSCLYLAIPCNVIYVKHGTGVNISFWMLVMLHLQFSLQWHCSVNTYVIPLLPCSVILTSVLPLALHHF